MREGPPAITPLPGAPPAVLGVVNVRGEVVPVLDTAALLGLGALGAVRRTSRSLDTAAGPAGARRRTASRATGDPRRAAGAADGPCAIARYAVDERVATLLDVDALLSPRARAAA